jgi:AcrR family transcriptional regulator
MDGGNEGSWDIELRRVPVQHRSSQRIESLLNAAAKLADEHGVGALTTSMVADSVQSSVGSIYRYFPNMKALLRALAIRNVERFLERVRQVAAVSDPVPLSSWDGAIDVYVEMHQSEPGFGRIGFGDPIDPHLIDPSRTNIAYVSLELAAMFAQSWELPLTEHLEHHFEIAAEMVVALIRRGFLDAPEGDRRFIDSARRVGLDYLRSSLPKITD